MPNSTTAAIVDDEPPARDLLRLLCAQAGVVVLGEAEDGLAALALLERVRPNLVFLDIAMPVLDGLAVARRLFQSTRSPAIIFTTAYAAHAVTAFDVGAVDYLLKPIDPDRFALALARARSACVEASTSDHIWVPHRSDLLRIDIAMIDRFEAERDYVRIHVGPVSYLLRETMEVIARRLPEVMFQRVHRSTILRRDLFRGVRHEGNGVWSVVLNDGKTVRIGRSFSAVVRGRVG